MCNTSRITATIILIRQNCFNRIDEIQVENTCKLEIGKVNVLRRLQPTRNYSTFIVHVRLFLYTIITYT